jgi:hypothetical protein
VEKKGEVLGFKFLGFLGDGFGVKENKKAGTDGLCSTVTGTHVYYINSAVCLCVCPGVDLGFMISTNGQDLDGRTESRPEIEV